MTFGRAQAALDVQVHVADDRAGVHFRAGCRDGDDGHDGQRFGVGHFALHQIPAVVGIRQRGCGDRLGAVDRGTAADRKDHVYIVFAADPDALVHGGMTGIRINARQLEDRQAAGLHQAHQAIIQTAALDGAAAVNHQHAGAKVL